MAAIRDLAIECNNVHHDADSSKGILSLCKLFRPRSVALAKRLDDDFTKIDQLIAEERQYESRLTFGSDQPFEITKEGVRDGQKFFAATSVTTIRWGITVAGNAGPKRYEYLFVAGNNAGDTIKASWATNAAGEESQSKHFSALTVAALNYLGIHIIEDARKKIGAGENILIGPLTLTQREIELSTHRFFVTKNCLIVWHDVATDMKEGQLFVFSETQKDLAVGLSLRDTANAVLLPILSSMMATKPSTRRPDPRRSTPPGGCQQIGTLGLARHRRNHHLGSCLPIHRFEADQFHGFQTDAADQSLGFEPLADG